MADLVIAASRLRRDLLLLKAAAQLPRHRTRRRLLVEKHRVAGRHRRREERFLAERGEIAAGRLEAERALEGPDLLVQELQPPFIAFVREARPKLSAFEFVMPVITDAQLELDRA